MGKVSDTMSNPEDLQAVRAEFQGTATYPMISVEYGVRRLAFTKRQTAFQNENLVFTMKFHQNGGENGPLVAALVPVYLAVKD